MDLQKLLLGLEFKNYTILDNNISNIFTNYCILVLHLDRHFGIGMQTL